MSCTKEEGGGVGVGGLTGLEILPTLPSSSSSSSSYPPSSSSSSSSSSFFPSSSSSFPLMNGVKSPLPPPPSSPPPPNSSSSPPPPLLLVSTPSLPLPPVSSSPPPPLLPVSSSPPPPPPVSSLPPPPVSSPLPPPPVSSPLPPPPSSPPRPLLLPPPTVSSSLPPPPLPTSPPPPLLPPTPPPSFSPIQPRFAKFLETSGKKVLVRDSSMEDVVTHIHTGTTLWKVRGVNKKFQRHYKVDVDNMSLVGESKKWWATGNLTVPLLEITEVRSGWKTDTFNKVSAYLEKLASSPAKKTTTTTAATATTATGGGEAGGGVEEVVMEEARCFSIIHGASGREVLDLVAETEEERDVWVSGLSYLVQSVQALHQEKQYDVWLRRQFQEADKDNNGSLNFGECCTLLRQLNIKMDKSHAKKLFNQANSSKQKREGEQVLEVEEFVAFYHALLTMPEVEKLFKKYASTKTMLMSAQQLLAFLTTEQGLTTLSQEDAAKVINQFEISDLKDKGYMTQDGFYHMLLSEMFDVFDSSHQKSVWQDMSRPLSHYYISSSHNTYLTGHQLAGESSVEGYISALKKGCRLLELDVWDGDDGQPIIYHGHTLTSKITLEDVLRDGVKAYAFEASPYPVILSVENHLCLEQQAVMVGLMEEILGDLLLTEPIARDMDSLPSPENLKNKIIIRGKKPQGLDVESDDEDDDQDSIDYIDSDDGATHSKKKHHKPLAPELTRIVNVLEGKKFISFADAAETYHCYNTPSIGETKAKGLLESTPDLFVDFTGRQVTKVYPLGTRTDSSNLKPYPFWSVGCQIVALNMQTEDKPNFYNHALFRSNASCGYVLKPDLLLGPQPYNPLLAGDRPPKKVRVVVLSGQHLPDSPKKGDIVDPYVQLKVRGHPLDHQKQRTRLVKNNGFNPVWGEVLEVGIRVPEVALLYFSLRDESSLAKDPVLALCCIPFSSLATGYRHVHLTDLCGKLLAPSALFVHVTVQD